MFIRVESQMEGGKQRFKSDQIDGDNGCIRARNGTQQLILSGEGDAVWAMVAVWVLPLGEGRCSR